MKAAIEPLARLQDSFLVEYRRAKKSGEESAILHQSFTTDSTLESLAAILKLNTHGLVFVRDELTGWAQTMDQYRSGKGTDPRSMVVDLGTTTLVINRKSLAEPVILARHSLQLSTCLPPDMLGDLSDDRGREDGFLHRILFAFPPRTYLAGRTAALVQGRGMPTAAFLTMLDRIPRWTQATE